MQRKGVETARIRWPLLLVELDTTGVQREDEVIHLAAALVDHMPEGDPTIIDAYYGFRESPRPCTPEALAYHGLTAERLRGQAIDLGRLRDLVGRAGTLISRNPRFTARKLHALVPACLDKRWYEYPYRIQGPPGEIFPADARLEVLLGRRESFGYGRLHPLSLLTQIAPGDYVLVFDEDGPPVVGVRFGRRKVLEGFAEALLKCEPGTRFRLHGQPGYDFITGYCHDGPAFRERAFRLAPTPANFELVDRHHLDVYLERVTGLTYHLALRK